jgi:tartrate dehydratase beta subunit/fumarate hydratase class I family protein
MRFWKTATFNKLGAYCAEVLAEAGMAAVLAAGGMAAVLAAGGMAAVLVAAGAAAVLAAGGATEVDGAVFGAGAADSSLWPLQALRARTAASDRAQNKA